jgi:type VI protein secretion system component VasK
VRDYPLLNLFWTMLWFFLWIVWLFLLIRIISDLFGSEDVSGVAKAAWVIFIIVLPFLGVLVYLIVRGGSMHRRDVRRAQAGEQALREYVQQTAGTSPSSAEELTKLAALRDQGVLTDAEFATQKAKILG